jgi:hypothetical protein
MFHLDNAGLPGLVFLPSWVGEYALFIIVGLALASILLFSKSRKKGLAKAASELGLQFFPTLSADQMGTRGASFVYMRFAPARNCLRGMIKGRETVIFDQDMPVDPLGGTGAAAGPVETTVVSFRVAANSFCRDRGVIQRTFWHVEKMGEWVFVYHGGQLPITAAEVSSYVEEARARFETATNPNGYQPARPSDPIH